MDDAAFHGWLSFFLLTRLLGSARWAKIDFVNAAPRFSSRRTDTLLFHLRYLFIFHIFRRKAFQRSPLLFGQMT